MSWRGPKFNNNNKKKLGKNTHFQGTEIAIILQSIIISDTVKMILEVICAINRENCMRGKDGKGKAKFHFIEPEFKEITRLSINCFPFGKIDECSWSIACKDFSTY